MLAGKMFTARLPYSFLKKFNSLSWQDIEFGLSHQLISPVVAIEFANDLRISSSEKSPSYDKVVSIDEPILEDIRKLARQEVTRVDVKRRWCYLLLAWLYENQDSFKDPLSLIEEIYTDFGYPKEVAPMIRYMPTDEQILSSTELNEQRLLRKWAEYVAKRSDFIL